MEVTRRGFLSLTGAAAGLILLPSEFKELLHAVSTHRHQWPGPGIESWIPSVCQLCPGGCGIRVRLLDGWPVSIRGATGHPINRGGLCPKGDAGLQALYDPDRIRRPLKRAGARGSNAWKEISWDEALALLAGRLAELRTAGRPEGAVVIGGQYRGLMKSIWRQFLDAYGSPNDVSTGMGCDISDLVLRLTQGVQGHIGYDLEHANYVLSFGVSLLEGSWSPVWQMRSFADLLQSRPGQRVKIVQVDTRYSMTAAKAAEWVPVRPGTDAALALGIAHVIVRDGLQDEAFLREHAFGFEDWVDDSGRRHEGFRTRVLRDYQPSSVAARTGVPEERFTRIAREFARLRPAIAMGDRGVSRTPDGLRARWAIHCLNALVGNLDQPGGILTPPEIPFTPLPPPTRDSIAERGLARPRIDGAGTAGAPLATSAIHRLPDAIRSGKPYPVDAVLLYHANPLFSLPAAIAMREALDRVPFVVSFSPYLDESAMVSDLVLPDHIFLERWQDDPTPRNIGFPVLGIRRPARAPLYDTRATSDVLFALAKKMGGTLRASLPWDGTEPFLKERVRGICESRRGMLIAGLEDAGPGLTPKALPPLAPPADFDEFWTRLLERGAWWDPDYPFRDWRRTLRTSSGRFEFLSQSLEAALGQAGARPPGASDAPAADESGAPEDTAPASTRVVLGRKAAPAGYPLLLNVFRPLAFTGGSTSNMPYLIEIVGKGVSVSWESWVEINPETARELGLLDRDLVWVESPVGSLKARARVYAGALPGVVNLPYGFGHQAGGRWAKGIGGNANDLLGADEMPAVGASVYPITWVKVYRA